MKKTLLAMAVVLASGTAQADFYVDVGTNFDGVAAPNGDKVCDTCTAVKEELGISYESITVVDDEDGNGIDAGDPISTDLGLAVGNLEDNLVDAFQPSQILGSNSNNGYLNHWILSFTATDLTGVVTGLVDIGGTPLPTLSYDGGGVIDLLVTFDSINFNNFMDIVVTGGTTTGTGTIFTGLADFTNVDAGFNDLFHSASQACNGDDSFFAIWSNCGETTEIEFFTSFDTDVSQVNITATGPDTFQVTGVHDGSGRFEIPEPGTLALLGIGLLGIGVAKRRKAA